MKQFLKIFMFIFIAIITLHVCADEAPAKKPPGPRPKFTAEQEACLKNTELSGLPAGDAKPTHEEMLAAMTKCNIEVDKTIESLRDKYARTDDEDEHDKVKADMRTIFYATDSKDVKQKVRTFFKDYREDSYSTTGSADRAPASRTK